MITGTVPCFFRLMAPGTKLITTLMDWIRARKLPNPTGELFAGRSIVASNPPLRPSSTETLGGIWGSGGIGGVVVRLTTYAFALSEVTATPCGPAPTIGVATTGPSGVPIFAGSITVTVLVPAFATKTRFPLADAATPKGPLPTPTHATTRGAGAAASTRASAVIPAILRTSSLSLP